MIIPKAILEKLKLNKKSETNIGLDIGANSIKAVVVEKNEKEVMLKNFNLAPINVGQQAGLSSEIKASLDSLKAGGAKINISFTGHPVIIRYAWLPLMSAKELDSSMKFEAAKLIPFAIGEVNVDSYILKQDAANNKMLVLIVAAKKEVINERLKLLTELGYKVSTVDVDSLALVNAFNFTYPSTEAGQLPKAFALLNIGAAVTSLNILEAGIPVFSRDIYIAGNSLTKKIADYFFVDLTTAERLKVEAAKENQEKIISAVESILSSVVSEIRNSFDYYESQGASSVEKIFLCGGGSLLFNLKDNLAHSLGVNIEYWDPTERLSFSGDEQLEKMKTISSRFAVALGLAIR